MRSWGGGLMNGISVLTKGTPGSPHALFPLVPVEGHRVNTAENTVLYEPGSRSSPKKQNCLVLGPPSLQNGEK